MNTSPATLLVSLLLFATPLAAVTRSGVDLPEKTTVEGRDLTLNGVGVRRKFFVDVYVGALYLEKPTKSGAEVIGSEQVKRVEMVFVRDVEREPLVEAFTGGFANNATDLPAVKVRVDEMLSRVSAVKKGDRMVFTYVPGKGTTLVLGGKPHTIPGVDFARALFSVWFGKKPSDADLRKGMLGE